MGLGEGTGWVFDLSWCCKRSIGGTEESVRMKIKKDFSIGQKKKKGTMRKFETLYVIIGDYIIGERRHLLQCVTMPCTFP